MNEPKISVIIPVYNVEKYLKECLDSVINQTFNDIEIICIDDGSTDTSYSILEEYAQKDDRFVILKQENRGAGVARNKGIEVARGEYIHFLDSDDWLETDIYEKLCIILNRLDIDLIKFKSYSYDDVSKKIIYSAYTDIKYIKELNFEKILSIKTEPTIIFNLPDSPWSGLYKKTFLQENNIYFDDLICANDVGFFYRCVSLAEKIYLSKLKGLYYRENISNSLVSKRAKNFYCQTHLLKIVQETTQYLPEKVRIVAINNIIKQTFSWYKKCLQYPELSETDIQNIKDEMKEFLFNIKNIKLNRRNRKQYLMLKYPMFNKFIMLKDLIIKNVFSIINERKHKVIVVLGIKIKVKKKK